MNPQITVIIPAYRRRNYLFYALDQILAQKDVTMEILVFSEVMEPDEVDEVEKAYPQVKYFKTAQFKGASEKRRAGIKMAQGEYLYMPDDDDYLTDDCFFRKALSVLEAEPSVAFVSGNIVVKHETNDANCYYEEDNIVNVIGKIDGTEYLQNLQVKYSKPYSTVSTIFRKQVFLDRKYNEMFEISDVCMYMNSLLWGDAYILHEKVAVYRFHQNNLTYSLPKEFMMRVVREKERVYKDSVGVLPDSRRFWYEHYKKSYLFYKEGNATKKDHFCFLLWGIGHNHLSFDIIGFCFKEIIKLILK